MLDPRHIYPALALIGLALTIVAHVVFRRWAPLVTNFQNHQVRTGYGLYVAAWAAAPGVVWALRGEWLLLVIVLSFAVPGFLDDLFGAHGAGGFGGHLKALFRERRVTTGLVKALAGVAGSMAGVALLDRSSDLLSPHTIAGAAVVALMANFINLLDLRPGRAGWTSLALWATAVSASREPRSALLMLTGPAFLCELALLPADSRGRWIMGDSGSNLLGALIGFVIVVGMPPWARWVALGALIVVHVYAERRSISRTIEASPALRWLDSRLGVR